MGGLGKYSLIELSDAEREQSKESQFTPEIILSF